MSAAETKLEMLRRHVRQGEEHIAKQHAIIARLKARGLPIEEAKRLLATFEDLQRQHEAHLARAEDEERQKWQTGLASGQGASPGAGGRASG
jgi:DNA-binding transcriptional MerR regulator